MSNIKSPQSWKNTAKKRRKRALKSYRPIAEKASFKSRKIGKQSPLKVFYKKLLRLIIILIILGAIVFTGAFFWYARLIPESTELLTKNPVASTKIYDRTGEVLLNDINADFRRVKINLDDLPQYVKWTAITAEDRDFYSHGGIDFRGIARAFLSNIFRGTRVGGSSISQQFVKNALLTTEKTYTRKAKEAILTWHLEKRFSKDEILELYFNEIPYGGTAYGIESAANKYFDKRAKDLNLAEAAALAALPQAPSYYSPYGSNIDKLLWRKDWILDSMVEEGYISQSKADEAKAVELEFKNISSSILAPHFVFYVREMIAEQYGEDMLNEGGLKIITTLDFDQQKIAEEEIAKGVENNTEKYSARNAALVALDVDTGEIKAMVGSANYFDKDIDGAVNVALRPRQPGSSFKPLVYAAAFAKGYSPETILVDTLTTFKTDSDDYEPHNYDEAYYGPVPMKKALAGSLNIPAVKTMYLVGVENILNMAEEMGYSTFEDRSRFGLSLVLGGGEVKLLEHVAGFSTLADDGEYKKPMAILEVQDKDGKTLEKNNPRKNKKKRILESQVSKQISWALSDNAERTYVFGEANYLNLGARQVAAKTGTTNDYKDAWTMGYTSQLATGVWVGNTRGEVMKGAAAGANTAAPIWHGFMKRVHEETKENDKSKEVGWENKPFKEPKFKDLPQKPMLDGKAGEEQFVKIDKSTGKLATDSTPASQIEEKLFKEIHNILHYVNKNNPLGPVPENPWDTDMNYNNWETAVETWAKENGYETISNLPTEKDDLHTEENRPTISISSPSNNTSFSSPDLNVNISASAPRGVKRVEYYIDNIKVSEVTNSPYNLDNFKLIGFSNGDHTLKAIAYDDVDNNRSVEIKINLDLPAEYAQPVSILKPNSNEDIYEENFPYPIRVNVSNPEYYEKIDFYVRNSSSGSEQWIGWSEIKSSEIVYAWGEPPIAGSYSLYGKVTDNYGQVTQSGEVEISIK